MTLEETLDQADSARDEIWMAIEGNITLVDEQSRIVLAYLMVALEHQESITLLIRNNVHGSALALVRSVFELFYRAFWVARIATLQQTEKIWDGTFDFPKMFEMVSALDTSVKLDLFKTIKALSWKLQNDFTHSGGFQIRSRFSQDTATPHYSDDLLVENISGVTVATLMVALLSLESQGGSEKMGRLERIVASFNPLQSTETL